MSPPNILLLQAREKTDPVIPEERRIFARSACVPVENVTTHDLLSGVPTLAQAKQFDALMVGGSGEYFVSKANLPEFDRVMDFLRSLVDAGHPTFASCFGFQLLVNALGGEITYLPEKMELGTYTLHQTENGQSDELFSRLPPDFDAHLGHKDQAIRLPQNVLHLAYSELAPFQAIRIPGKPIWATQFHPEVTRDENFGRFKRYVDIYSQTMSPEELRSILHRFTPAPDSRKLIPFFMDIVFGWSA